MLPTQSKQPNVAIILPSRGLMHSRMVEGLLKALTDVCCYSLHFAHGRSLPECFNEPIAEALDDPTVTHIWIVEDDIVLPPDALEKLLAMDEEVVAYDYPVGDKGAAAFFNNHHALWTGTGCILIQRGVLDALGDRPFRTDLQFNIQVQDGSVDLTIMENNVKAYGLQDVEFGIRMYQRGSPIRVMREPLQHLRVKKAGKRGTNDGADTIEPLGPYQRNEDYLWKMIRFH